MHANDAPPHAASPSPPPPWTIAPMTPADQPAVAVFNKAARTELFPELARNEDTCLTRANAVFVVALTAPQTSPSQSQSQSASQSPSPSSSLTSSPSPSPSTSPPPPPPGAVIGVIGLVPYDARFPALPAMPARTAEVVRLYVAPTYRRCGLAGALFGALRLCAAQNGYECLYLHTHPFLPGALRFWEKMGFVLVREALEGGWRTLHMVLRFGEGEAEGGSGREEGGW